MNFPHDQIEELKKAFSEVSYYEENGKPYFLIPQLKLPEKCVPDRADVLLCPISRDGYPSRLFFSQKIDSPTARNWNCTNARIIERNWFAFSWKVAEGSRLIQLLINHLRALR